jgi:hypothetical protein
MPKYALIENDIVVNAIEAEEDYAIANRLILLNGNAGIGWAFKNGEFIEPEIETVTTTSTATKEQLMAELAALTAKINAME